MVNIFWIIHFGDKYYLHENIVWRAHKQHKNVHETRKFVARDRPTNRSGGFNSDVVDDFSYSLAPESKIFFPRVRHCWVLWLRNHTYLACDIITRTQYRGGSSSYCWTKLLLSKNFRRWPWLISTCSLDTTQ